jgi:hypothetical protein
MFEPWGYRIMDDLQYADFNTIVIIIIIIIIIYTKYILLIRPDFIPCILCIEYDV